MDKRRFFIADTHFGHSQVINYENRPFTCADDMDKHIIENWNKTVAEDDEVFLLGDFSFYDKEKSTEICKHLKGKKILVMGNHDENSVNYYEECGFDIVCPFPIIIDEFWILSHEPLYINKNMPYANIFGHVHASSIYSDYSKQSFCVCVERIEYTPVEFTEIKNKMFS